MTVKIKESFTGYPDGEKARRFAKDEVVTGLPADFQRLIIEKGHAKEATERQAETATDIKHELKQENAK
jgi:hypothetical protein